MTSTAPKPTETTPGGAALHIELSVNKQIQLSSGNYGGQARLERYVFKWQRHLAIFSTDLTLKGSIFQRVGAHTAKTLVHKLVLTLGTKAKLDAQSWTGCLTGVSNERKYDGCLH